jgi:hypothetical protein
MGRAISITASSWAWVRGQVGAMAMAGVIIASAVVEEDVMSLVIETAAAFMPRIADVADQK